MKSEWTVARRGKKYFYLPKQTNTLLSFVCSSIVLFVQYRSPIRLRTFLIHATYRKQRAREMHCSQGHIVPLTLVSHSSPFCFSSVLSDEIERTHIVYAIPSMMQNNNACWALRKTERNSCSEVTMANRKKIVTQFLYFSLCLPLTVVVLLPVRFSYLRNTVLHGCHYAQLDKLICRKDWVREMNIYAFTLLERFQSGI